MPLRFLKEFLFEGDIEEKFLIKQPLLPLSVIIAYTLFVLWIGPAVMRYRKPFQLKMPMIVYNFIQCLFNAYVAIKLTNILIEGWGSRCLLKESPNLSFFMVRIKRMAWLLYLIKFADLLDTVFFVLRKKQSHVTALHVTHHGLVCFLCWWFVDSLHSVGFYLGLTAAINSMVHVVMYFYYGLARIGPHMQKYLWWKKYLTQLQILQFFVILIYMTIGFITGCEAMDKMEIAVFSFVALICILFLNFYKKYN